MTITEEKLPAFGDSGKASGNTLGDDWIDRGGNGTRKFGGGNRYRGCDQSSTH
jgi:hypothetical protein